MKSIITQYLLMGMTMMADIEAENERRKDEVRAKWRESMNYPRKKKKLVRKRLLLDWNLACWNPFEI